jgi:hypothetical protein
MGAPLGNQNAAKGGSGAGSSSSSKGPRISELVGASASKARFKEMMSKTYSPYSVISHGNTSSSQDHSSKGPKRPSQKNSFNQVGDKYGRSNR